MCVTYKDCEVRLRIAAMMSLLRIPVCIRPPSAVIGPSCIELTSTTPPKPDCADALFLSLNLHSLNGPMRASRS
jgi:hypothetical protein